MGKSSLGPGFWGQWYRTDKLHYTDKLLKEQVEAFGLQTTLDHRGTVISMKELRDNMLKIKEHLRSTGFRVPCASDARVVCVWDLQPRACNSAYLQAYLVQCDICPLSACGGENVKNVIMKGAFSKRTNQEDARLLADGEDPGLQSELGGEYTRLYGGCHEHAARFDPVYTGSGKDRVNGGGNATSRMRVPDPYKAVSSP
eukprot:scaffold64537_cov29-Phaeocystis_antarctica.AAC.3